MTPISPKMAVRECFSQGWSGEYKEKGDLATFTIMMT